MDASFIVGAEPDLTKVKRPQHRWLLSAVFGIAHGNNGTGIQPAARVRILS